ncbi:MAG TPA: hypothetical protein VGD79_10510, partial [Thermoanaerobaculia bacterium]
MENLRWIAAAALSAYACHFAVHHTTPIDHALPFLGIAVTVLAWLSYSEVLIGVPVLIGAEIAVGDERVRLLIFGLVLASAVGGCVLRVPSRLNPQPAIRTPILAVVVLMILRWIPLDHVQYGRELALLILAAAIVVVLGRTPFAVTVAVIVCLVTTAVPLRTLASPLAVLLLAAAARTVGLPALRLAWPSAIVLGFVMLFFAWSGIVARAFPYFLRRAVPERSRTEIRQALAPRRSETYDVPDGARSLIVSAANVAHLRKGTILGRIEPGPIDVRIGDAADWGYLRREAWHKAH